MTVATTAGGYLIPNNTTTGMRYTKAGITCAVSRNPRSTRSARSDRAVQIPSGTPISSAITTDRERVTIAGSHTPSTPTANRARPALAAARIPPVRHAMAAAKATTPGQRSSSNRLIVCRTAQSSAAPMGSKKYWKIQLSLFCTVQR
jgi:hypothetical protein